MERVWSREELRGEQERKVIGVRLLALLRLNEGRRSGKSDSDKLEVG